MKHPISIIIPVYKNYEMFFRYLKLNARFFNNCEVIILNDFPLRKIAKDVKKIYPQAITIDNIRNFGFAGNVNQGILKASNEYVFLMNSDVRLRDNSFLKTSEYFKSDEKLFAVGYAQIEKDGKTVGSNRGYFEKGLIHHSFQLDTNNQTLVTNFWAEGGASIFRKELLLKLGMFDELFNPFYWEDVDLSYRAWKTGYKILYDPKTKVEHHHESTIGKYYDKTKILEIAFQNQLIFQWKNLTDFGLIVRHLINLPKYIFKPGFKNALKKLPEIMKSRKNTVKLFTKSDKSILNIFV